MIPISLELKNFLSYGPELQKIDFAPYHLMCLAGKNGHGKSGLLDAITWALWGQARKIAGGNKADAGLLRLGQTHMVVILTFECNGNTYRVRREYLKAYAKPVASLDIGMLNPQTGSFESITDKSIPITQRKIESIVGLDYDTFINSAFLRQGSSNEFSKKSPKERKEILASILGLDRFEKLRKYTFEKLKIIQQDTQQADALIAHIQEQLKDYDALIQQKTIITQQLQEALQNEKLLVAQVQQIEQQLGQIHHKLQDQLILKTRLEALAQQQQQLSDQLRTAYREWKMIHGQLLTMPDITHLYSQRKEIADNLSHQQQIAHNALAQKQTLLNAQEKLQQRTALLLKDHQEQHQKLEIQYTQAQSDAAHTHTLIEHQQILVQQLEQEITAAQQELVSIKKSLNTSALPIKQLPAIELQFEKRRTHYQKYIAEGNCIVNELTQLKQKKVLVQDSNNPTCPLCEQHLPATRKRILHTKFAYEESFLRHRLQRLTNLISRLKNLLVEQHTQLQLLQTQLQEQQLKEHRLAQFTQHIEQLNLKKNAVQTTLQQLEQTYRQQSDQKEQLKTALEIHQQQAQSLIAHDALYQELNTTITQLQNTLAVGQPAITAHESVAAQLQAIDARIAQHATIMQEKTVQEKRKTIIAQLCTRLKQIKKEITQATSAIARYQPIEQELSQQQQIRTGLMTKTEHHRTQTNTLLQTHAQLEHHLSLLDKIKQECTAREQQNQKLRAEQQQLQTLITALGKDGIQALLIEDALPEIEQETNTILSQLTDNQAHIRFESLRDLKSGGTKETLDINISDTQGIRPYEMFSGGEAFRIDFALRIAISKLLAHRAGATLQTLIIDEGFGSQDEEGLQQIINALYAIGQDFAKIIIVSHLSTMKNAFPVQLLVHKGPNGSTVSMVEQG